MILRKEHLHRPLRAAFTLMEMMVVVAILVVLVSMAVPMYMNYLENAKMTKARLDIDTIENTCNAFKLKHDRFPTNLEELWNPQDGTRPYLKRENTIDPWGQVYQYEAAEAAERVKVWTVTKNSEQKTISNEFDVRYSK